MRGRTEEGGRVDVQGLALSHARLVTSPTSSHALASTLQAQTPQCEMADWSTLYIAALDARDRRESTNKSYIDACTPSTPTALFSHQLDH
jgi:hypothetical protein